MVKRGMHMDEQKLNVETLWCSKRNELYELLMSYNEGLAELYKRAINELDPLPSEEMSAVTRSTISYYARELLNNLPEFVTDDGEVPSRGQYQEPQRRALERVIELANESSLPAEVTDGQRVLVSGDLAVALRELAQAHENGSSVRRQRDSVIALGHVQENSAVIGLMEEARRLLVNHQHVDLKHSVSSSSRSDYVESFKVIEDILLARLGSFFGTVDDLRALIRSVEEPDPDNEPNVAEVTKKALRLLGDYQHRRVFYEGIRSSKWMPHLKKRGAFNTGLQDSTVNGSFLRWPEGDYLSAVANTCAEDVASVCLAVGLSKNPYVQAQAQRAAARLSGDTAMQLHEVAVGWSESMRTMPFCFEPHDASLMITHLFVSASSRNQLNKAEKLLKAYFVPVFNHIENEGYFSRIEVIASIPEYCFREELEFVIRSSRGKCGYPQIQRLLECFERRYCEVQRLRYGSSAAYMRWRPSIGLPGDSYPSEYGNHLVDTFVRVMREEADRRPGCLCEAYQRKSTLVSRASLYVLSGIIARLPSAIQEGSESLSFYEESVVDITQSIINDPELLHKGFDAEAVPLVQACLAHHALFDTRGVVTSIEDYRQRREETRMHSPLLQDLSEDERDEMAASQSVADEHLLLTRLGRVVLPEALVKRLDELDSELGAIDAKAAAFSGPFYGVSWGYESPVSYEQLIRMSTEGLASFLRDWRPKSIHDEPSVTGLANMLEETVSQNPMQFAGLLSEAETFNPTYVGAILRGMSTAIGSGDDTPVDDLAVVCAWVCAKEAEEVAEQSDSAPDPKNYYSACSAVGDLAGRLMRGEAALSSESWWHLLEAGLYLSGIHEPSKEFKLAESYPNDPATVLINLLMPKGVEILSEIAGLAPFEDVREEAMAALERLLLSSRNALVYGAFGMAFPPLSVSNQEFAQNLVSMVLRTQRLDFQAAFLYPMCTLYRFSHGLFCQVRPIIEEVVRSTALIDSSDPAVPANGVKVLVGRWIYLEREAGYMALDDHVYLLWRKNTTTGERRNVLNWVCHRASGEKTPAAVANHAIAYWDEVREHELQSGETGELTGVFMLAHNPLVETRWLASRMVIEASENDVSNELAGVRERLVDIARVMPAEVICVLEYAASTQTGIECVSLLGKSLARMLAYACESYDEAVADRARALMDKLGRHGLIKLDEWVYEVEKQEAIDEDGCSRLPV